MPWFHPLSALVATNPGTQVCRTPPHPMTEATNSILRRGPLCGIDQTDSKWSEAHDANLRADAKAGLSRRPLHRLERIDKTIPSRTFYSYPAAEKQEAPETPGLLAGNDHLTRSVDSFCAARMLQLLQSRAGPKHLARALANCSRTSNIPNEHCR